MRAWILALTLFTLTVSAQAKGNGKGKGHARGRSSGTSVNVSIAFSNRDRAMIQQWAYSRPNNGLPPGLQKKGLPPGLQRQLIRNGHLPPGLQKKITPFPQELLVQMGPQPARYDYVFLGGQALVVDSGTNIIVDVMALF